MCLMKNSLSFDYSILVLSCHISIWSPCLSLLWFILVNNTTFSYYQSSGLSWSLLISSLDTSALESLSGYISGHKSDTGSYSYLLSADTAWWVPLLITPIHFSIWIVCQWPCHGRKYGIRPIYILVKHHVG